MKQRAIETLTREAKTAKADRYGAVVKAPLLKVLCDFCRQDQEFAQAVVQGGSFEDCLKAAVRGAQNHTPDIQVYRNAVQFYFPSADIRMSMTIDLIGRAGNEAKETERADKKSSGPLLDLSSFL